MSFRTDINGLRAWAVIAVVLFHFNIAGFTGGFVGVDIFFVISGFLMTQIIVNGLCEQKFRFWDFFRARIRRIVPALFVLCAVTMAFGWFVLDDTGYRVLIRHIGSTLLFGSNFKYWREAGYFDDASHEKLLLHTWSLSVEWQFYMLLPLILMMVWKIFKTEKSLFVTLIAFFAFSLFLSVFYSVSEPGASFFLLHTRAWEMISGGLVFFCSKKIILTSSVRKKLEWLGFFIIIFSIFWLKPTDVWPGYLALLPVAGAMLVLLANSDGWFTNNKISQWLGANSYSIYLWHWPLAAILNYSEKVTLPLQIAFVIISIVLGQISYKFLEIPGKNAFIKLKWFGWAFFLAFISLLLIGNYTYHNSTVSWRIPEAARAMYAEARNINPGAHKCQVNMNDKDPGCRYGGPDLGVIVIGDSHAAAVVRSVEKALPDERLHVRDWSQAACSTVMGFKSVNGHDQYCAVEKLYEASKQYDSHIPMLIVNRLAANFHGRIEKAHSEPEWYLKTKYQDNPERFHQELHDAVVETACKFAEHRPVYMLRHIPELKADVPAVMGKTMAIFGEYRRISVSFEEYLERTALVRKAQDAAAEKCGVKILDSAPYLCETGRCWGDFDGHPVYFDDDHLSERGGARLVPEFRKIFQ